MLRALHLHKELAPGTCYLGLCFQFIPVFPSLVSDRKEERWGFKTHLAPFVVSSIAL